MDIEKLIKEIIPPSDYAHRNGFNNTPLIDKLSSNERMQVEDALIYKLIFESKEEIDTLIIETLVYLKSQKSLQVLQNLLTESNDCIIKLIIATSIFEINEDINMIDIAINCFKEIEKDKGPYYVYILSDAFYYLSKFKNSKANGIIKEYVNHKEYLIAYNAKQALMWATKG